MRSLWMPAIVLVVSMAAPALAAEPDLAAWSSQARAGTIAAARIDLARLQGEDVSLAMAMLRGQISTPTPITNEELTANAKQLADLGAASCVLLLGTSRDGKGALSALLVVPMTSEAQGREVAKALEQFAGAPTRQELRIEPRDGVVLAGPAALVEEPAAPRAELATAMAAAGDAPLAVAVAPSADQRRVLTELLPSAAPQLAGDALGEIVAATEWTAVAYEPKSQLRIVLHTDSPASAARAEAAVTGWLKQLKKTLPRVNELRPFAPLATALTPKVEGDNVTLELAGDKLAALDAAIRPAMAAARSASDRARAKNCFKQLGLAMHNYHDAQKHFPNAAITGADGKPLLSWRVALLPYLDQGELYKRFKLDEPWDSEHNRPLVKQIPEVFQIGGAEAIAAGKTCAVLPIGEATAFPDGKGLEFKHFTDGTSNTILIVEADDAHAVEWTRPADLAYGAARPLAGLGQHFGDGFLALFGDGSVHYISSRAGEDVIRKLITPAGNELIQLPN